MAENKMKEVAELLGIEMDKSFKIDGFRNSLFKITNNGFISSDGWRDGVLDGLLTGRLEIEKPILSDVEKRYLESVLRPFKNRILFAKKTDYYNIDSNYEYVFFKIVTPDGEDYDYLILPYFIKGTMYEGMELDKEYKVEELGLFEGDDE